MNSISYWLSLAQLTTNATFFIAFRMHSLSHKSLSHSTYRLRRLTTFGFRITDTKNQSLIMYSMYVSDANKAQNRYTNALAMLFHSNLHDKLDNAL